MNISNIKQIYFCTFTKEEVKNQVLQKYNLQPYNNVNEPAIFLGCNYEEDRNIIRKHNSIGHIIWFEGQLNGKSNTKNKRNKNFLNEIKSKSNLKHYNISYDPTSVLENLLYFFNIEKFSNMYNIKQVYFCSFRTEEVKKQVLQKYNLQPYNNINEPAIFLGCNYEKDRNVIRKHNSEGYIFFYKEQLNGNKKTKNIRNNNFINEIKTRTNLKSYIITDFNKLNVEKLPDYFIDTTKKYFIYYSMTHYNILFQRPQQIMRFMNSSFNKIFIGNVNEITYDNNYDLLIVPYSLKNVIISNIPHNNIITYFTDNRLIDEIMKIPGEKMYDLIDAPISEFEVWKPNLHKSVTNADYVIYSHPDLIRFLKEINKTKEYHYISNACDYEHFSKAKSRIGTRPSEFPKTNKPILGYYGSFAEWLDYDLIRKYADEGKYHIVMIGGIPGNKKYNIRFSHSNITWLEHKPYEQLPYYLSWFDVCFLPFKSCELNKYVNPCKLWEYMASNKEIIKHNVNMNIDKIVTYNDVCEDINQILSKKSIAIVLDKYLKGGIEKHTDILKQKLNSDVLVFNQSLKNHPKINDSICSKYNVVLWQNVFNKLPPKNIKQKYIYIVHSQCNWWDNSQKKIVKENNHLIDIYIYVSNSVKENFEKNILKPNNSYVIENQLPEMKNDRQEIQNLFVSSGSFNKMKGHYELIQEFSKLNNNNKLEIYGDIHDRDYFNMLQKHITDNKLDNIKLFEYTDNYINRLKEAEYFCLFSKSEGCSYSMLEAISLNKKIICTKECLTDNMSNYQNLSYKFKKYDKNNSKNNSNNNFYFTQCYKFIINNIKNEIIINKNIFDKFYDYTKNENKYDVTIITPSYNCSKKYLSELKNSIEKQTFQNWFWLIINDCSTNKNSIDYLNELNNCDNIVIFSNYENNGPSFSRQKGLEYAKSDILFFIDDDDYIELTALEKYFWFLKTEPNVYFVNSYLYTLGTKNFNWFWSSNDTGYKNIYENFTTSSWCMKKFKNFYFFTKESINCEDWINNMEILYKYGIFTICEKLFNYRYIEKNESSLERKRNWIKDVDTLKKKLIDKYLHKYKNFKYLYRCYYKLNKGDFPGYGYGKLIQLEYNNLDYIGKKNEYAYINDKKIDKKLKYKFNIKKQYFDLQHYKKIINDKVTYESFIKQGQYMPWHTVPYKQPKIDNFEYIGKINKNYKCDFMFILPWLCMGGADRFYINLINSLQKKGKKIVVVYTECDIFNDKINEWIDKINVKDSHILYHFLSIHEYKKYIFYLINTRRPDHIFISNSMYGTHITKDIKAFINNKSIGSKLSHYVHMEEESWYDGGYARFAINNLQYLDNIYVTTNYLKKWMLNRLSLDKCDKIKVFMIGTNIDIFKYNKNFNSNENILNVISICRFVDQKKPMQMLKLIHKIQKIGLKFHFNIYGHGPYENKMKTYIKTHNLKNVTLNIGNRSDVEKLLYQSHILLQTSLMEGLPSNFFESISCGVPVISNNVGGNSTLIKNGKNGYLINPNHDDDDYEINQYIDIFKKLDSNRNELLNMHNNCINMRNDLEIENIVDKLLL